MHTHIRLIKSVLLGASIAAAIAACGGGGSGASMVGAGATAVGGGDPYNPTPASPPPPSSSTPTPAPTAGAVFSATNVVTDSGSAAAHVDPNLINGWGIAFNPKGYVWVANQGTSTSTLYDGQGVQQSLIVTVPAGAGGKAGPTGIVFNGTQDFKVTQNGASGVAAFIFVGTGGTVSGWAPSVNGTQAITMVDTAANGGTPSAYTGLTLTSYAGVNYLYAADFRNNRVDVYDTTWKKVTLPGGSFVDPNLPAGYAPFGIQAIGNRIYVTYAQHAPSGPRENLGAGLGIVDVFDPSGAMLSRFATGGALNAPWGVALAPANFGGFGNMLLVGNFGDGKINVYDPATGAQVGTLSKADKTPIVIDGLWGIAFGNGINSQPTNTLFYAAGPGDGAHGLYGRIDPQ
jgi:uncharacterized protein (TIGR03118 family)